MPSVDEDRHALAAVDGAGVSPGAQAEPNDCRFGRVGDDHPGSPGRGAAISTEAGFDIKKQSDQPEGHC